MNNSYNWNKKLKFSWGHIIAFIGIIFLSYVCFMGDFYANGGNFSESLVKIFIIDTLITITFIGAQQKKATESKFNKNIFWERFLIVASLFVFLWTMIPYNHFWTIHSKRGQIKELFSNTIKMSKNMFDDYVYYSDQRIANYDKHLTSIIANKATCTNEYFKAGFSNHNDKIEKGNYMETLRLQLKSDNIEALKNDAYKWIDNANKGASVWNAFLVGNINRITDAINGWGNILKEISMPIMSNESSDTEAFKGTEGSLFSAKNSLQRLRSIYQTSDGVASRTIWTGLIVFFMLLVPYIIQERNLKAKGFYSLFPSCKKAKENVSTNNNADTEEDTDIFSGTL